MTAPLLLSFDPARPGPARTLAASLPASVKLVETAGEIALVDGQGNWPEHVAGWIGKGVRRVLVLDPDIAGADTLAPVLALAAGQDAQVSISETHADNPATPQVRGWLDDRFGIHTITGHSCDPLAGLILQQLRIARATGLQGLAIDHAVVSADAAVAVLSGALDDTPISLRLTATRSAVPGAHHAWMAHAPDASASLTVFSGPAARPAQALHMTTEGGHCPPTIYEHAHRASLRAMLTGAGGDAERVARWLDDAALARAIGGTG